MNRTTRATAVMAMLTAILLAAFAGTAIAKDQNRDRIPDRWEQHHGLSLKHGQARHDQDSDSLNNRAEFRAKMDPLNGDTDGDGIDDGDEGAGTIASFDIDTGELTVNLFGGPIVTGVVNDQTLILCGCRGENGGDEGDEEETEPADGPGEHGNGDYGHGASCGVDPLVVGVIVHQAELRLSGDGLVFTVIRLVDDGNDQGDDDNGDGDDGDQGDDQGDDDGDDQGNDDGDDQGDDDQGDDDDDDDGDDGGDDGDGDHEGGSGEHHNGDPTEPGDEA